MTLDEAIKRYEERKESLFVLLLPSDFNMLELGIEALKRTKERRQSIFWSGESRLPGETEE